MQPFDITTPTTTVPLPQPTVFAPNRPDPAPNFTNVVGVINSQAPASESKPIMTIREAGKYLSMSPPTIRKLMGRGILQYAKLPTGAVRIRKEDLDRMLQECLVSKP